MSSKIAQSLAVLWSRRFFVHVYTVVLSLLLITCTIGSDGPVYRSNSLALAAERQQDDEHARTREIKISRVREPERTDCVPTRETFIECVGRMVREENEIVSHHRARIMDMQFRREFSGFVALEDALWLDDMKAHYGVKDERELLRRVNTIPVEMALAQSLLESGWGTSYAARVGKGLFGQIQSGGTHSVTVPWRPGPDRPQPFSSHRESVTAYFINLNTHPAYAGFRAARESTDDPVQLMNHMQRYSIRGTAYIREIQGIIVSLKNGSLK